MNSHCRDVSNSFEAGGVSDHLVQSADDVGEARSHVAVFLPTVQHQLVQRTGAVHGGRQTVVLLNGINYLGGKIKEPVLVLSILCDLSSPVSLRQKAQNQLCEVQHLKSCAEYFEC